MTTALVLPLTQILGNSPISIPYANQSLLVKQSLDFYHTFSTQQQLLTILLSLLSFAVLKNINFYAANISINKFMLKGGVFIRQSCIERFLELEMPFYTKTALGEILSYVNEQAQRSERLFSFYLEMAREIISLFFLLSFLIILSPMLTLVTVGSLGVVVILLQTVIKQISINGQKSAYAIENFSSLI
ncbi:MAG: ABC transporter transmembrane domain-containing protein, partial [Microcystaceae cyanobacterium]